LAQLEFEVFRLMAPGVADGFVRCLPFDRRVSCWVLVLEPPP
jgi:hypothetical protein